MSRYAERYLNENEWVVEVAPRDKWGLVGWWILGILFFWLLFIPLVKAIKETVVYNCTELVLTNKRLICKQGVFHVRSKDIPLLKIQGVYVDIGFWGRIFNFGTIHIDTEYGHISFDLQDADDFKASILGQIDRFELDRLADQSLWTARAMLHGSGGNVYGLQQRQEPVQNNRRNMARRQPQRSVQKQAPAKKASVKTVKAAPDEFDRYGGYGKKF